MTFNIQHGIDYMSKNKKINLKLMADTISACQSEIVGLNEVRNKGCAWDYKNQARIIAKRLGYDWYFAEAIRFKGGPYGNALITKYPIIKAETVLIEDPAVKDEDVYYEPRCILKALIKLPCLNGFITVFVTHLGLAKAEQKNGAEKLMELINHTEGRYIVMGDLNMQPDDSILQPLLHRLKDTAAAFSEPQYSYPSHQPDRKIDYILTDSYTAVISADIPAITASDHRPLTAVIEV